MKLRKLFLGVGLCALLASPNKTFSQENPENEIGHTGFYPGFEVGYVINKTIQNNIVDLNFENTRGITLGIYVHNNKFQVGYIAEINRKDKEGDFSGNSIDLGKVGMEIEYFPIEIKKIKPYIGSEVKYEDETLFIANQNKDPVQRGVGLELKLGTEIKPLPYRKIRGYLEFGYNLSFAKKSKNYPKNPKI
ncbi:MAG TPA: hypothetical protein PK357_02500, partial [Candidatus Pacearchaeota archaeon]|nr:hypothetical protein [Candidatus Pacearchaeota archaeon]